MLALVPRERPGVVDPDPLPVTPAVYNDVDTPGIAGGDIAPPTFPALVLYASRPARFEQQKGNGRVEIVSGVIVTAGYLTSDEVPENAVRDGGYVLRAVHWSAKAMNDQIKSNGYRAVNGTTILSVGEITEFAVAGAVGACRLWGFIQIPVKAAYTQA